MKVLNILYYKNINTQRIQRLSEINWWSDWINHIAEYINEREACWVKLKIGGSLYLKYWKVCKECTTGMILMVSIMYNKLTAKQKR